MIQTDWERQTGIQNTDWERQTGMQNTDWERQTGMQNTHWERHTGRNRLGYRTQTGRDRLGEIDWNVEHRLGEIDWDVEHRNAPRNTFQCKRSHRNSALSLRYRHYPFCHLNTQDHCLLAIKHITPSRLCSTQGLPPVQMAQSLPPLGMIPFIHFHRPSSQ